MKSTRNRSRLADQGTKEMLPVIFSLAWPTMLEMLEELLEQEQFELLFPKENGAQAEWECYETYENNEGKQGEKDSLARVGKEKIPGDIRLVYLMNDAVESFLIFRDARLTGSYLENYEGPLKSSLS